MIRGSLYFTNDTNVIYDFIRNDPNNNIIVAISQNIDQRIVMQTGALVASVLTPNYECFMYEVNGNLDAFCSAYYEYLNRKECMDYIAAILKALTIGKNIMLYATPEESETNYISVFRAYLAQTFGIVCGDQVIQFSWLQNMFINVAMTLYLFDLYSSYELFEAWKVVPMVKLPEGLILKLIKELNPPVLSNFTLEQYHDLFLKMAIGNNGTQLTIPATIVK